jgi:uncharacterized protein YbbC (DUF1343 family)
MRLGSGDKAGSGSACGTGLDRLFDESLQPYRGMRAGLIANPASVDRHYVHAVDRFAASRDIRLAAVFGPQHGARADQQDNMIETRDERDPRLGIPVYSLYSERRKPTGQMIENLDVVFCDLFDVGVRAYTFLWTMALAMQACAEHGRRFVVLDRPNPIGGIDIEGNVLDADFASFIGLYPVPMRHGLTAGEMAALLNGEFGIGATLDVIEVRGWTREHWLDRTGLPWIMPSPNMATLDTAAVYPGSVLVEGTNLSEGRGTTHPFEILGAPFIDAYRFAGRLNESKLPAVRFRPVWFKPVFDKWQGQLCGGAQIHVLDRGSFRPYLTGLTVLAAAIELYPKQFAWRQPPFEYEYQKMPFDILAGSGRIRAELEKRTDPADIERGWQPGLEKFRESRRKYLRY